MINKNRTNNFGQLKLFCENNGLILDIEFLYNRYNDDNISITELLSILVDPGFEYVKANHTQAVEEACERGTAIHNILECHDEVIVLQGGRGAGKNMLNNYYKRFREWKLLYSIDIIEKEKTYYKDGIRGTIDAITNLGIVDYKTSRRKNEKYKLQIAGYSWLSGIDKGYILYMDEKKFDFEEVDNLKYYKEVFLELLEYSKTILKFKISNND